MYEKLDTYAENTRAIHELLNGANKKLYTKDATVWLWNAIKWYDDFEDIVFIENLIQELNEQDYLFIRIGEDSDDTEVRGYFWDNPFEVELIQNINICEIA